MPPKGQTRRASRSPLAFLRHSAGIPQVEMARRMGLSIATYQRLEERRMPNPPLGYLVNAAIVLDGADPGGPVERRDATKVHVRGRSC